MKSLIPWLASDICKRATSGAQLDICKDTVCCICHQPRQLKLILRMQIEGLRLWRVCALYDLPIASLDALWPLLAAHFAGPPAAAAMQAADAAAMAAEPASQPANAAAAAGGGGNEGGALQGGTARFAMAREALLTAAELVCHAARCNRKEIRANEYTYCHANEYTHRSADVREITEGHSQRLLKEGRLVKMRNIPPASGARHLTAL